jgi:type VI secretion system secreted protein VgrG
LTTTTPKAVTNKAFSSKPPDAYGAVRAGASLKLSTYKIQHNATYRDAAGDNAGAISLLKQANVLAEAFSKAAGTHHTVTLSAVIGVLKANTSAIDDKAAPLKALLKASSTQVSNQSLDQATSDATEKSTQPSPDKLPHSGEAILSLEGQGGIAMVAGQSLQLANSETTNLLSGQDSHSITGGSFRLHTGQAIGFLAGVVDKGEDGAGLTLIASNDPVRYEAQNDAITIAAKELINVQSANAHIDWASAKKIIIRTEAGACITIENGNIKIECPGKLTVYASLKSFDGPTSLSREAQTWPSTKFDEEYVLKWPFDSTPVVNRKFKLVDLAGIVVREGRTNAEGKTGLYKSQFVEGLSLKIMPEGS